MSKFRKKIPYKKSKKYFTKNAKFNKKNAYGSPMRGGIRL